MEIVDIVILVGIVVTCFCFNPFLGFVALLVVTFLLAALVAM